MFTFAKVFKNSLLALVFSGHSRDSGIKLCQEVTWTHTNNILRNVLCTITNRIPDKIKEYIALQIWTFFMQIKGIQVFPKCFKKFPSHQAFEKKWVETAKTSVFDCFLKNCGGKHWRARTVAIVRNWRLIFAL